MESLRLTKPYQNNVHYFVSEIQSIEPNNREALAILERASLSYQKLFSSALKKNKLDKAESLLVRAPLLGMSDSTLKSMSESIEKLRSSVASSENFNSSSQSSINIQLTEKSDEQRVIELAAIEIKAGERESAIRRLRQYIKLNPRAYSVLLRLFKIYNETKSFLEAENMANEIKENSPVISTYILARIKEQQGDDAVALDMLKELNRKDIIQNKVLAYRAALAHKLKDFQVSKHDYMRLIQKAPEISNYWLGLAVSCEALGEYEQALTAYKKVKKDSGQSRKVRNFVAGKVQALGDFQLAGAEQW